jgi:hypothetical protein
MTNTQFQVGKTYQTFFACDYDSKINMTVLSRTAKTIKVQINHEVKTLRVSTKYNPVEVVKPFGSYSMAPAIDANDLIH